MEVVSDRSLRRTMSLLFLSNFFLLYLYTCCCFQVLSVASYTLHDDEIEILKKIDSELKIGWDFSVDPCSGTNGWVFKDNNQSSNPSSSGNKIVRNLTCGDCINNTCHVTGIEVKGQNLTGILPAEFADLKSLVNLDLTRNYINGTIPPELGRSTSLLNISLGNNQISGLIPEEIGNITALSSLVLENNLLQGSLPGSLGRLTNLTRLIISANDFTGELPESLGNLKNLIDFRIDGSGISGKIPSFMGNWTKLGRLHMQGTSLEGPFPPIFSHLVILQELRVSDLKGVGSFPPLQDMNLQTLVLRNCSISDKLPEYVGKMTNLQILDLSFNNCTGEIPTTYRGLALNITNLYLTNNMLSGAIPDWILQSKRTIDLSFNSFDESSTPSRCDPQGTLLNVFSSCSSSSKNSLINPCLKRNFPCWGRATNYDFFINCGGDATNLGGNYYDEDKAVMGSSTFFLSPYHKWAFTSTGDFFMNPLANYIAYNKSLLDSSTPKLYTTARLSPLSLRYYGLCLQKGSYTVDLHFAEIMFIDDRSYYSDGRRFFDVFIQGQKVLEDFNIVTAAKGIGKPVVMNFSKVEVNDNTLEIHFRWSGKGTNSVPEKGVYGPLISAISVKPNFKPEVENKIFKPEVENKRLSVGAIAGIVVASFVAVLLIMSMTWFIIKRKRRKENVFDGLNLRTIQFSLAQIRSATGNFDHANKIGQGGFGSVFKGTFPDGTMIAVKQLSSKSTQGNKEFINEIGMISALQHPNLVKLLGCCIEENQLLLVYEFLENNSLFRALLGSSKKRIKLDWQARCNICLGVARGLVYLHEESRLKIIHRDIKATNILLDKNLNAKISDFGLAKLHDEKETHISTRIAGTRGYMAPEYAMRGRLTDKADVYSFGIVLLEVLTGKSNVTCIPCEEDVYLLDLAYKAQENGKLLDLVDEDLGSDYPQEKAEEMIKLALLCANSNRLARPTMSKVVSILESDEPIDIPSLKEEISKSQELKLKVFQDLNFGPFNYSTAANTAGSSTQNSGKDLMHWFNATLR